MKNLNIQNAETIQSYFTRVSQIKEQLEAVDEKVENEEIMMTTFVIVDFTTHGGSHIYGISCPSVDSLDPMDHFVPLMFPRSSLKKCNTYHT